MTRKMSTALSLPSSFHSTALAFPDKVKAAIAQMETVEEAVDGLAKATALAEYAERMHATDEEFNYLLYGKLLMAAKVGELCPATPPKKRGRGHTQNSKGALLFSRPVLADYRKLTKHQAESRAIDRFWAAVDTEGHARQASVAGCLNFIGSGGNLKGHQNKGVIEWYTPAQYIKAARKTMGSIDLDPASSEMANKVVKAKRFYTQDDDGLEQLWAGNVWMNPPFMAVLISKFIHRLCEHVERGDVPQAILLTNNNTDTRWWHEAAIACAAICFTAGRVAFYNPAGDEASPTNGHTFFYFGEDRSAFCKHFGEFGSIMELVQNDEDVS